MGISERIDDLIKNATSAEEGAGLALEAIFEETATTTGTIHLIPQSGQGQGQPNGQMLELVAARDIPPAVLEKVRVIPIGKGMAGVAVEKRQPVTTCNLQQDDAGGVIRQGARATGAQGALAVPIIVDDEAIGALGVATREPRDFTRAEIDALLAMASAVGRALRAR
jgi:L-methionine (R)-S-oxide reductase